MLKQNRGGTIAALIVLIVTALIGCYAYSIQARPEPEDIALVDELRSAIDENGCIVHAGGFISDQNGVQYDYTNSLEALENCIASGQNFVEIDFDYTYDDHLVCCHEWDIITLDGTYREDRTSFDEYNRALIHDSFTPMTSDKLAEVMRQNPQVYIITDPKHDFMKVYKELAKRYPDLRDRFIIQIYHEEQYNQIWKLGFHNIIYTLYRTTDEERKTEELCRFASNHLLVGFTFWDSWLDKKEGFLDAMLGTGVPVYVHTVNETDRIEEDFSRGVSAVYTDLTDYKKK
jgi:glycerophosphoryl diester phosphodiesterase